jgi:cell division transport system ATP-binding protein
VALPLRVTGQRDAKIQEHVTELLTWVGLADQLDAYPATLSGGQQQRVAIARAVIARPSLLLADEPTGNVDDRLAVRLLYLLEELNKLGTTVVIATHNEQLVGRFCHPVLRLSTGGVRLERAPGQSGASGSAA